MMSDKFSLNPVAAFGRVSKVLAIPAVFALLVACSSYEKLPPQSADSDYKVFSVTSSGSGEIKIYLIKAFEDNGKTAMCGGYTSGSSALSSKLSRTWADISQIYLDGSKLGNADFMIEMPVYSIKEGVDPKELWARIASKKPATGCVRSEVDWRPEFLNAGFERKGPNSIRDFD